MTDPSNEAETTLRKKAPPSAPPHAVALVVLEGPEVGQRFAVDGTGPSRVLLGQSVACDIRLTDPQVSRRHAALDISATAIRLRDLDSTNGTFVSGVRIVEALLAGGEVVRMGGTVLRVDLEHPSSAARLSSRTSFGRVIGASAEMRRIYPVCERLAQSTLPVVIEGETGTGKELLAEALHEAGPRAERPFLVFDCTTIPSGLVDTELFGHEPEMVSSPGARRVGLFEQAQGGTLLIDEIGELPLGLQPKLLRALERGEIRRVGGDHPIPIDVRVIAATRRDLDREVNAGRFRDDLFHRLVVARIELPPLRHRQGDVSVLARHFYRLHGNSPDDLSENVLMRWNDAPWPGNVRELRNAVALHLELGQLAASEGSSTSFAKEQVSGKDELIERILSLQLPLAIARQHVIQAFERRYIEELLERHGGNIGQAASAAGVARRYFQLLRSKKRESL